MDIIFYSFFHYLLPFLFFSIAIQAHVPANKTFKFINRPQFQRPNSEYRATYHVVRTKTLTFSAHPFDLCFYNTTPGAYILAIRAGTPTNPSLIRSVWDANRNNPVGENSILSFLSTGNLILSHSNGSIVWQTNTSNIGVTGLKLLPNGNLVLHNNKGGFLWQSFHHPADTLLLQQSLRINSDSNKLVSRKSDADGSDGPYNLILKPESLYFYYNNRGELLRFSGWNYGERAAIVTLEAELVGNGSYELALTTYENDTTSMVYRTVLATGLLNGTISFVRLGSDGNLRAFSYNGGAEKVLKWEEKYAYFSTSRASLCALPTRCGSYGVCERGVCVACPTQKGLSSWNQSCAVPVLRQCGVARKTKVEYYKIEGVEHFLTDARTAGEGMELEECRNKCDGDCMCVGFFYYEESSRCLIAPVLGTLRKSKGFVAYIKYST